MSTGSLVAGCKESWEYTWLTLINSAVDQQMDVANDV